MAQRKGRLKSPNSHGGFVLCFLFDGAASEEDFSGFRILDSGAAVQARKPPEALRKLALVDGSVCLVAKDLDGVRHDLFLRF